MKNLENLRERSNILEGRLKEAITVFDNKFNNIEKNYEVISAVINFINEGTKNIQNTQIKSGIIMVGSTGAGKSTLLNYVNSPENIIVTGDSKLKAKPSIAEIGSGKGSTTLFPNIWLSSIGNFLDCAGEGDTGGVITEVINSVFKTKVAREINEIKILLIAPYASLDSEGGYGMSFKNTLDKNAQFLTNIDHFKSSIGVIISAAGVKKSALENAVSAIENILEEHSNLKQYEETIKHVLSSKNIVTFSKPSSAAEEGEVYQPPSWNLEQHAKIVKLIENLPFTTVPNKDFFNISTTSYVREVMNKALNIVEIKSANLIKDMITSSIPVNIFALELKPFVKYCGDLTKGINSTFIDYIKILHWNNYFKVKYDIGLVKKLDSEMSFLMQFTEEVKKTETIIKTRNWTKLAEITQILKEVYDDARSILSLSGNTFTKFISKKNIVTKSSSEYGNLMLNKLDCLYNKYSELQKIKSLKLDQTSKYYNSITKKQFSHTKNVLYKESVKYHDLEYYDSTEDYEVLEKYYVKERKSKDVIKYKWETKTEYMPVTKYREESYEKPVTKYKTVYYQVEESAPGRTAFFGVLTFGISALLRGGEYTNTVTKSRQEPYTEYVRATKNVSYTDYEKKTSQHKVSYIDKEYYTEEVPKWKYVTKTKPVTKSKVVEKYKLVDKIRKEDVYEDLIVREFNSTKHDMDVKKSEKEILEERKGITNMVSKYIKPEKLVDIKTECIVTKDHIEELYRDLLTTCQNAEYVAYFTLNNNSLQELSLEEIGKISDFEL